ncbi:conserved hypothetical protein [Corynebacterium striatum]|nr:conserved hypothetical protein [Corynebacterium striatum]
MLAHPRLRGADVLCIGTPSPAKGSSPLTRGGPTFPTSLNPLEGLIPAYAGRTNSMGYEAIVQRAHPRLRGADRRVGGDY